MEESVTIDVQKSEYYTKEHHPQEANHLDLELTEVSLEKNIIESQHRKKTPKRTVYFSDGPVDEFSDDEEKPQSQPPAIKSSSSWSSYIIESLDSMGEKLAWYLGITSPKYQYAIDEYWRRKKEEEEEKEFEAREVAAKIERRGRRNIAMEKEVSMISNSSNKKSPDSEMVEVMCKQPSSGVEMVKGGLINEGFDDSLKY